MALALADRIKETTTVTSTGPATLLGASVGYQSFGVIGNGNTTYYCISDQSGSNWEVGIGTYTSSGNTLARTKVLSSSNADALVSFTAGTKDVFVTYPAETAVSGGGGGTYPTTQPSLNLDFANTKLLDPRITFVRNSTAAYYDGQTSAMAEQNLFLYSQAFSTYPWAIQNGASLLLNNSIAPDGTTTASLLTFNGQYSSMVQGASLVSGATYTLSFWAKTNTNTNLLTVYVDSPNIQIDTYTPTSSWVRYSFTFTSSVNGVRGIYPAQDRNTSGFGSIYIWGAQLEQRSSATAYTPTTTAAITNYIPVLMTAPAGVARFDCDPVTRNSLGLLIEESRVNLLTYSGTASAWAGNSNTTPNLANGVGITPDGTNSAINMPYGATGYAQYNYTIPADTLTYTCSFYAKSLTGSGTIGSAALGINGGSNFYGTIFNFATLTTGTGWTATSIGNGWYRLSRSFINTSLSLFILRLDAGGIYTTQNNVLFWGAQLEAGSFATSYIPTVASTVTRAADQASMTGTNFSSWYNQSQGSLCWEVDNIGISSSANYRVGGIYINGQNTGVLEVLIGSTGYYQTQSPTFSNATLTNLVVSNKIFKIGLTASISNCFFTVNGIQLGSNSGYQLASNVNSLFIGALGTGQQPYSGHIRKLSYYPVALSSSSLVALTS